MGVYSFVLEYDVDAQDVYLIRGTLRAFRGTDNPMTVFVRTEQGPMDLSAVQTLEAVVTGRTTGWWASWWPGPDYGLGVPNWRPLLTVTAYSPEPGRVMFTLPAGSLRTRLWGSQFTLFIRADDRTIYTALLDVI